LRIKQLLNRQLHLKHSCILYRGACSGSRTLSSTVCIALTLPLFIIFLHEVVLHQKETIPSHHDAATTRDTAL